MPKFTGHYIIDLDASAKLHIGWFTDRFEMTPEFEQEMQEFMRTRADLIKNVFLTLDRKSLRFRMGGEEEVDPVKSLVEEGDKPQLIVTTAGRFLMTYELRQLGPDLVQFSNPHYDLHNWAWRRTGAV